MIEAIPRQPFAQERSLYAASLALALLSVGCLSAVAPPDTGWPSGLVAVTPASFVADTSHSLYVDLSSDRFPGGQLTFVLPGTPTQVLDMLLDFDRASGHRAWAQQYRLLERDAVRTRARWTFKGKFGINPEVTIEFRRLAASEGVHVEYGVIEGSFGMRSFAGEYRLTWLEGPTPMTLVTQSVFIDSGLRSNASPADIEAGLRADARQMKEWMLERLGDSGTTRVARAGFADELARADSELDRAWTALPQRHERPVPRLVRGELAQLVGIWPGGLRAGIARPSVPGRLTEPDILLCRPTPLLIGPDPEAHQGDLHERPHPRL